MPTVDNVNNWFHARKNVEFEHKVVHVGRSTDKYPIIGAIIFGNRTFPAVWDFTGNCSLCGDMTIIHRDCFNLLPIDREQAWLAEELADLWKYIEPEFKWCTINIEGHPIFWSHRPIFNSQYNCWIRKKAGVHKAISLLAIRIETKLPVEMTLQERPEED